MRSLFAVVLLATALSPHQPVHATSHSKALGRCRFSPTGPTGPTAGTFRGDLVAAVALLSIGTPGADPVAATVTCEIRVDNAVADSVASSGAGLVVVSGPVEFPAGGTYQICTVVDFADPTPTSTKCDDITLRLPPQEFLEFLDELAVEYADPVLCPMFQARAPGAGPLFINDQGDVYVAGSPQWDCPPYDIWGESPAPFAVRDRVRRPRSP